MLQIIDIQPIIIINIPVYLKHAVTLCMIMLIQSIKVNTVLAQREHTFCIGSQYTFFLLKDFGRTAL